ncbi:MAG: hypothetical protein NTV56_19545 [Alphaproteobacteria bacterium]|nr:hypothetical protein [Alphaproteobacteria bacterium]
MRGIRHKDSQTPPQCSGIASNITHPTSLRIALVTVAYALGAGASAATAGEDPSFGIRIEKPDGSAAITIGRRLPTLWETKVGADVRLAAPEGTAASDNLLRGGAAPDQSSGAVWGNLSTPALRSVGIDKTAVEARLDAGKDEGKVGATLSRSVPINPDMSVTLQNTYSVKQSLASTASVLLPSPGAVTPTPSGTTAATPDPAWSIDQSVRLNVDPLGTTLSAGAGSSTQDSQWHNKLSVEQTLFGPLKLTTSVEDAGTPAPKKSIFAEFKRTW